MFVFVYPESETNPTFITVGRLYGNGDLHFFDVGRCEQIVVRVVQGCDLGDNIRDLGDNIRVVQMEMPSCQGDNYIREEDSHGPTFCSTGMEMLPCPKCGQPTTLQPYCDECEMEYQRERRDGM